MLSYTNITFFQDPFDSQSSLFEPATRLCLFEVEKSVVTVVLPSDSSVQIHCLLNGCVVEDVRKGTISAFPRFLLHCYRVFSHDVTAAMLVSQNKEMAAMLVSQTKPLGIELYFYANTFFSFSKPIWPVVT